MNKNLNNNYEELLKREIPVGVSNRHIHLSQEDLDALFGKGYKLTEMKNLKQPGQFAAKETVYIAGPKGCIFNVRVLGPVRKSSQVEISKTDSFILGIKNCPLRESGDLKGSEKICVIGPKGNIILKENVIIAKIHIHMNSNEAKGFNVKNGESVNVITLGDRKTIFGDVVVRVNDSYKLELHLDTDEANAASLSSNDSVKMIELK
ncbi:phosphate propanoyltransferase [Clostridium chauvoei]|uniref:Phosphate propanoyltransferase n=1 Tax=Clostridium chauvoei TaxID=46867 RepID=A0ABD4RKG2_9CLOT|nr:phosphate propanoyltransferase [Clostridium chauvoei]ATD54471.1 phosphate propanoyltransferase [Clostridium chauvoei]MBX7281846.1 phosphate propanoyltransferase [Clostridium chauvoei]MBX7291932.1 phosphate propanoyltransferase [Clostridium chauvoei]MBX7302000.1 phosphate propanoyltransferase [Clostridium chauvoei]MBX7324661.1 phosphate propanoyltransferase [Clostridium chauvoei]